MSLASSNLKEGESTHADSPQKYLTFKVGAESYGIAVLRIREIIRMQKITPIPQMPPHMRGVINLRGKVIPVADLRVKFGIGTDRVDERTCTIVVQYHSATRGELLIGLVVDAVEEVVNITKSDIEPAPDFGSQIDTRYMLGMAKIKGEVKTLINIDLVITDDFAAV